MKNYSSSWGTRSVSFWLILLPVLGIIFIGARFIISPQTGATGYGIPLSNQGNGNHPGSSHHRSSD